MNRRQFLTRGAATGLVVWAAPTILTVDRADAATRHSAPPVPPSRRLDVGEAEMGPPLAAGRAALLAAGAAVVALNREGARDVV